MKRRDFLKVLGTLPLIVAVKQILSFPKSEPVLSEYEVFNTSGWGNRYWPKGVPCDAVVENGYSETWYTANIRDREPSWKRIGWAEMRTDGVTYFLPLFEIE